MPESDQSQILVRRTYDISVQQTEDQPGRSVVVETRNGPCQVVIGPWQEIGRQIPNTPHLLQAESLAIQNTHDGQLQTEATYADMSVLVGHGARGIGGGFVSTVEGKPYFEIIDGLRNRGYRVDALAVCDSNQIGKTIQINELGPLANPVVFTKGGKVNVGVVQGADGWHMVLQAGQENSSILHEEYGRARAIRDKITVRLVSDGQA